jgi:hypothetical protein
MYSVSRKYNIYIVLRISLLIKYNFSFSGTKLCSYLNSGNIYICLNHFSYIWSVIRMLFVSEWIAACRKYINPVIENFEQNRKWMLSLTALELPLKFIQ